MEALKIEVNHEAVNQYGIIKGTIEPFDAVPAVFIIEGTDTVGAVFTEPDGSFCIDGLGEGIYGVLIMPEASYCEQEIRMVNVVEDDVTDLGVIKLECTKPESEFTWR